jgi:hypothetical protein
VALAGVRSSSTQLTISGNDELTVEAYEYAQSLVDAVIETPVSFVMGTNAGYTSCMVTETGCDNTNLSLSETMFSGLNLQAKVTFLKSGPMPRKAKASSLDQTSGAYFDIYGKYDETANNKAKAEIGQGMVIVIPTGQ